MDEIIAEEIEIERKLKALKDKCKSNYKVNLRSIKRPEDVGAIAAREREEALKRNAEFLQELETAAAKLHTKRLCPLQKKLDELKTKSGLIYYPKKEFLRKRDAVGRCVHVHDEKTDDDGEENDTPQSLE